MAIITMEFPIQAAKISGVGIALPARIVGADLCWKALFATDQTEQMIHMFEAPQDYASAPVVKKKYAMTSATSGKVDLETEVMAIADGEDVDTASFDSVNEVTGGTTVPGVAGDRDSIEQALANDDSMLAEETILLRDSRDHDDADDTAAGDLEYITYIFEYST